MNKSVVAAQGKLLFGSLRERCGAAVLASLLSMAFLPTLAELGRAWFERAEYGHGALMPPIALWLLWSRRRALAALRRTGRGSPWTELLALLALLPIGLMLLLGEMRLSWFLKPLAFVAALAACIAILYSWEGLKALATPLLVLCLMCPIPWRVLVGITLPLKRHASVLATGLADLSGLDASLEGNLIHVPGITSLQIADQCSGINSFLSLVSVALLGCLLWRARRLVKIAVLLSCAPIAVAVNAIRIWLTAFLAAHVSPAAAQGFFHLFEGFLLFGVAALALLGLACLLAWLAPPRPAAAPTPPAPPRARPDRPLLRGATVALAALVLAGTALAAERTRARLADSGVDAAAVRRMQQSFGTLPLEVGGYRGELVAWDERTVKASGADAYGSVRYRDAEGRRYQVYLGGALRNDDNFHAPNVCMPSAGWDTIEARATPLRPFAGAGASPVIQRLLLQKGDERMLVYYWFQAGDRLAGDEWVVRFYRLVDLLRGQPLSPALIVSIYAPVEEGTSVADADAAAARFLAALAPHLRAATVTGGIHG